MKILINCSKEDKAHIGNIFGYAGYEPNNLIFVHSFNDCKVFFEGHLEKGAELDLIITDHDDLRSTDSLNPDALLILKNSIEKSFSHGDFRISSIPIILYSDVDDKSELRDKGFDAIVKKNNRTKHSYFIKVVEEQIRKWRKRLVVDMDNIGLSIKRYPYFKNENEKVRYKNQAGRHYERIFFSRTSVLSKEFIANPVFLKYDWLTINSEDLEQSIVGFSNMFRNHVKYDRKNNERTIIHSYLRENRNIIERDSYFDHLYEMPLMEVNGKNSQICDFILRANIPSYQTTTFFEIKKENVQLMVNRNSKRPQPSSDMHAHLYQLYNYKSFSLDERNADELFGKLGYSTSNFSYQLLAGRLEEKEEMQEVFNDSLRNHFPGIEVYTFEEFEQLNHNYFEKITRLKL